MGLLSTLVFLAFTICTGLLVLCASGILDGLIAPGVPKLPKNEYWGEGQPKKTKENDRVEPMTIAVGKEALADLQVRLKSFRFIKPLEESNFEYGFNGNFMQQVVQHWLQRYSWKEWEQKLNSLKHYRTTIEGLSVHFVRQPASAKAKKTLPLLIVHGWPGSVLEFYKLIPLLTEPDASGLAFEIIAPSIPGYAWSQAPSKRGFNIGACARIFHKLMLRLGHSRYYAQGGDWGAFITHVMARQFESSLLGHHTNMPPLPTGLPSVMIRLIAGAYLPGIMSKNDSDKLYPFKENMLNLLRESGYMHLQATRPDSVGHALHDSPIGLAAYIMEKFCVWTVPTDRFTNSCNLLGDKAHFNLDELLTNVIIYWTTDSITSSMRLYKEVFDNMDDLKAYHATPSKVPHGVASFKYELTRTPAQFVRKLYPNLLRYSDFDFGGHFPALQLPKVMNEEIREFIQLAEEFNRQSAGAKVQNEL